MRRARQRGYTVLELLVSASLLTFVVLTAVGLLDESGRLMSKAQVDFAEPSVDLTTRWLRRDIQGAAGIAVPEIRDETNFLEIVGNPEGTLRYEKLDGNLDRVLLAPDGTEIGRRTLLRRVTGWEWRVRNLARPEVEIVYKRMVRSALPKPGGVPIEMRAMTLQRAFLLRGIPKESW